MATNNPPSGYDLSIGTWGTDADQDTATFLSGFASTRFFASSSTTPELLWHRYLPVDQDKVYALGATVQADRINVGDNVSLEALLYDQSRNLVRTYVAYNAPLTAIGQWDRIGTAVPILAGEHWARYVLRKANAAFNVYADRMHFSELPAHGETERPGDVTQSIVSSASWVPMPVITGALLDGRTWGLIEQLGAVSVRYPGVYHARATVCWDQATAAVGDYYELRMRWDRGGVSRYCYGDATPLASVPAAGLPIRQVVTMMAQCDAGDVIRPEVRQQNGSNRTVLFDAAPTSSEFSDFQVTEIT